MIPCFNEPDLIGSLQSLWENTRPEGAVEVIVVVNSASDSEEAIRSRNAHTLAEASAWARAHAERRFRVELLYFPDLPPKRAGVGLARKIGMDEALRRFADVGRISDGVIVCFDADCRCASNYLRSLERLFRDHPRCPGCSVYFEHPLEGPLEAKVYEAITRYELHLRYYVQALRFAAFPFAYHTVGSCMAVRANVYAEQGGMNKRPAGEDFYFLQKIFPLGGFLELNDTVVFPSSRASDRVPFGTGKAIGDALQGAELATYPLEAFADLKTFLAAVPSLCQTAAVDSLVASLPESLQSFLPQRDFAEALRDIRANTSSAAAFERRFFRWFDGFQVMKFVHHACDAFYGARSIATEPLKLLQRLSGSGADLPAEARSLRGLLATYRALDRGHSKDFGKSSSEPTL